MLDRRGKQGGPEQRKNVIDRSREERQWLLQLKQSRAAAFRSEIVPYFRYVAQSGFGLLVSAALFFLVIQYVNWLDGFPSDVPLGLYGAVIIALIAVWSPFRTYFQQADVLYLLPLEAAVHRDYIRPMLIRAARFGALRVLAAYAILAPLYIRAPHTLEASASRPLWLLALILSAIGACNAWGAWQERRTVDPLPRMLLRLARYAVTFVSVWALLNAPLMPALAFSVLSAALVTLLGRLPLQQLLPWEQLIREEAKVRRRWSRFLSWFVDMPSEEWRPARRRWAAWIGDKLPWGHQHVWRYLYAKSFVRSETFGTWMRWHLVILFLMLVSSYPAADWTLFGIGVFAAGIQLTELSGFRFPLSVETMPLPGIEQRRQAAARVARTAGGIGTLFLWLGAVLPLSGDAPPSGQLPAWPALALLAAGLLWSVWIVPRRLAKRRDEDDG